MNRGIIVGKIVGHGDDFPLNGCQIRPLLCHNKALTGVLFPGSQGGIFTASDPIQCVLHRDCILLCVQNPRNSADRVRVALADALAPEGIVRTVWQDAVAQQTLQAEHTGVPADADKCHMACLFRSLIAGGKMLGDSGMGIKTVHHIKVLGILRGLLG